MDAPPIADVVVRFLTLFECVDGRPLDTLLKRDHAGRWVLPETVALPAALADAARELRDRYHACVILGFTVDACTPAVAIVGDRIVVDTDHMRTLLTERFTRLSAEDVQHGADNAARIAQMLACSGGPPLLAALVLSAKEDSRFDGRSLFHRMLVGVFDPKP